MREQLDTLQNEVRAESEPGNDAREGMGYKRGNKERTTGENVDGAEKTDGGIQGNNNNEVYRSGIFPCKISPVVEKETQVRLS